MSTVLSYGRTKALQGAPLVILATLLQAAPALAVEPDIVFQVPITIHGMTTFKPGAVPTGRLYLSCVALDAGHNLVSADPVVGTKIQAGEEITLDDGGNFSGTVSVGLHFWGVNGLALAKFYWCYLVGIRGSVNHNIEVGDGSMWWHVESGTASQQGSGIQSGLVGVSGPIP